MAIQSEIDMDYEPTGYPREHKHPYYPLGIDVYHTAVKGYNCYDYPMELVLFAEKFAKSSRIIKLSNELYDRGIPAFVQIDDIVFPTISIIIKGLARIDINIANPSNGLSMINYENHPVFEGEFIYSTNWVDYVEALLVVKE